SMLVGVIVSSLTAAGGNAIPPCADCDEDEGLRLHPPARASAARAAAVAGDLRRMGCLTLGKRDRFRAGPTSVPRGFSAGRRRFRREWGGWPLTWRQGAFTLLFRSRHQPP